MKQVQKGIFAVYVTVLSVATISLVLLVGAIVHFVDPYGITGSHKYRGFNSLKPAAQQHSLQAKVARAKREIFSTIVVGNSRVDAGFDPESQAWPREMIPAFNFGIPGRDIAATLAAIEKNQELASATYMFLGIDFLDLLADGPCTRPSAGAKKRATRLEANFFLETHLSLLAVQDTAKTLLAQRNAYSRHMTDKGFNPWNEVWPVMRAEGQSMVFHRKNVDYVDRLLTGPKEIFCSTGSNSIAWTATLDFVKRRALEKKNTILFLHPYHVDILVALSSLGLMPSFEQFKLGLVTDIARIEADTDWKIPIWDFAAAYLPNQEEPPGKGDFSSVSRWFWEASHYRPALGDQMVKKMLDLSDQLPGFGARITSENYEIIIAAQRRHFEEYVASEPNQVLRITRIIDGLSE